MIVWIVSFPRSGNTFFRIVMRHTYGINTYAAFRAGEVLTWAGAGDLVGHKALPAPLKKALGAGDAGQIRAALDDLETSEELFVFKSHARPSELFGTNYRAILVVRDGRDVLASYVNYLLDVQFGPEHLANTFHRMAHSKKDWIDPKAWIRLGRMLSIAAAKRIGLRRWVVSKLMDRLLHESENSEWDWSGMNRSWLDQVPKPVVVDFNDLVRDPLLTVTGAVDKLGTGLKPVSGATVPSFADLKKKYPGFFRKGTSGDWKNHFSPAQEKLFRLRHQEMMERLGFRLDAAPPKAPEAAPPSCLVALAALSEMASVATGKISDLL